MSSMYGATGSGNRIPKGYQQGQLQQFTPEQMQLFSTLFGHLGEGSFLSRLAGGDEEIFNQIEKPALKQFTGQLGNIASRFSGQGMGGRHSSGFQNTATGAASDFAEKLQSNRAGLQSNALKDLMGMSQMLLGQRPQEQFLTENKPGFLESLLGSLGSLGGQGLGMGGSLGIFKMLGLL